MNEYPHVVLARVERSALTGDVTLALIRPDEQHVSVQDGAEFVTGGLKVDPFAA